MKNINNELEQILVRNKVIKEICFDDIVQKILSLKNKVVSEGRIGLYGTSLEADNLLHFLISYIPELKIDLCFDKVIPSYEYQDHIKEKKVHKIEEILSYHIDYMIIGSYRYRDEMKRTLRQVGFEGEIIDFYEFLGSYIDEHYADYEMIFQVRKALERAEIPEKIELTQKLIKYYILIKDFESAKIHIRDYIEQEYNEYERYIQLESDLEELLKEIHEYLNQRNQKDIIVNWIDALPYNKINDFPFLKSEAERGVTFDNAYTIMPWTRGTLRTVLYGKYPITDKLFLQKKFLAEEAKTLKLLIENNYKFAYCGLGIYAKTFDDNVITKWGIYTNKNASSISRQWDALSLMCENDQPLCILIHTLYETHGPYICGECETFIRFGFSEADWEKGECKKQAEISGKYIDKKLDFYNKLYGNNAYRIYMSDHGNVGDCIMDDHKIHVIFIIEHKRIRHEVIQGMFSLVEFPKVIEMILMEDFEWAKLEDEKVIVETYDAYDERKVNDILAGKLERRDWLQCRGVITEQDKYFLYADGVEYYFPSRQENKNEIENKDYAMRISRLREICNLPFINIYEYDDFMNSRKLYE